MGPVSPYGTEEEMKARAGEGYYVRDPERDLVYCPGGETLRRKSIKKNGSTRYANKQACNRCRFRARCIKEKGVTRWKELDFGKDCLEKKAKWWEAEKEEKGRGRERGRRERRREREREWERKGEGEGEGEGREK